LRSTSRILFLLLLIFAGILILAIISSSESVLFIQVSPDGKWVACAVSRTTYLRCGPEPVPVWQRVFVCWGGIGAPEGLRWIKVRNRIGFDLVRKRSVETHIVFSPTARYLAVTSPHQLTFVETESGKVLKCRLGRGIISSLAWVDDRTVGYVTHLPKGTDPCTNTRRTVWRQRAFTSASTRRLVHVDALVKYPRPAFDWPWEYWSPNGRYVLFSAPSWEASALLLDTATGRVWRQDQDRGALRIAAWKPDSSAVVWTSYWPGEQIYRTYLMTMSDRKIVDLTDKFREVFGNRQPSYDPLWTPDGEFLVCSGLGIAGCLIRPVPWEVRILEKPLKTQSRGDLWSSTLRRQPAPGILIMNTAHGEVAIDYQGLVVKHLGWGGLTGWMILPDGKKAVSMQPGYRIAVVPLCGDTSPRPPSPGERQ